MDTTELVRQAKPTNLPPLARGYILAAPASFSEKVKVIVPEGSSERTYGPCNWNKVNGTAKPTTGAACVIAFDNEHFPTVVWWDGTTPTSGNEIAGTIRAFVGITLPEGWLLCDGTEYKVTTYKLLFEALGSKEGKAGEFAVPDLKGRFPLGVSGSHALLTTGGEEKVKLTEGQMPAHTHPEVVGIGAEAGEVRPVGAKRESSEAPGIKTSSTGGGESHENMPPFLATKWIIATGIGGGTPGAEGKEGKEGKAGVAGAEGKEGKAGSEGKEGPAGSPKTAKAPLKVVGTEIELEEGQLTNAYIKAAAGIEESKLSLPEVIIKTTSQTITGQKTVESATPPEEAKQTNAKEPLIFVFGNGNVNTTVTTNPAGGTGAEFKLKTGAGGRAINATIKNTGGTGGRIIIETGAGGTAAQEGAIKNSGGPGGLVEVRSGSGGTAGGSTTGEQIGGAGGVYSFRSGGGGNALIGTGINKGGKGGSISFITGEGGRSEGAVAGSFGAAGGALTFETGEGGASEVTKGKGGPVQFVLGNGGGATEASSGAFQIYWSKAEAAKLRFEVTPEGLTKAKAGLTVEGALTLPAESVTEGFYKKESVSKEKLAKAVQEELLKIETPTALGLYTNEKEEEEAKGTFVTAVVTLKAEAAAGTVKLVNSGKEQEYKWDGIALGAQKVQLTWMVKKAGKWKITFAGAVEKVEVSRVTMEP